MDREGLTNESASVRRPVNKNLCICLSFVTFFVLSFIGVIVYSVEKMKSNDQYNNQMDQTFTTDFPLNGYTVRPVLHYDVHEKVTDNNIVISGPQWLQRMEKKMHLGYKPCSDFYERSCKEWENNHHLVHGQGSLDEFLDAGKEVFQEIKSQVENGKLEGDSEQKAKSYFDSCIGINRMNDRLQLLDKFKRLLKPKRTLSIQEILTFVHSHNAWPLFTVDVAPDPRNITQHKLMLFAGTSPLKNLHEKLGNWKINSPIIREAKKEAEGLDDITDSVKADEKTDAKTKSIMEELRALLSEEDNNESSTSGERKKRHATGTHEDVRNEDLWTEDLSDSTIDRMVKTHNAVNELIYKYVFGLSDVAPMSYNDQSYCSLFGTCRVQKSAAKEASDSLLQTELAIFKAMRKYKDNDYGSKAFEVITLRELQSSCHMINWSRYIKDISKGKVASVGEVVVMGSAKRNLFSVCRYVDQENYNRFLKDYLLFALFKSLSGYFDVGLLMNEDLWNEYSHDERFRQNHWWHCMSYTQEALELATSSVFVRSSTSRDSVGQVREILDYVKKAFREKTLRKPWMDRTTEAAALRKLDSMLDKVGYPSYVMNQTYRDEYYQQLRVTGDYYANVLNSKLFLVTRKFELLSKPAVRTKWSLASSDVNAAHTPKYNDMTVPLAIMRPPFYDSERPIALNFGSLGAIIGHELTHAFGTAGRYFDFEGARDDWMSQSAENALKRRSKCFVDQYDAYTIGGAEISANRTLDENIADNGGLRTAYYAYDLWVKDKGEDASANLTQLYTVNGFSQEQLFFTAFSQMYCSKFSDNALKTLVSGDHSPGPLRVKGTLSNMVEFSTTFACPRYSIYNPWKKCIVW